MKKKYTVRMVVFAIILLCLPMAASAGVSPATPRQHISLAPVTITTNGTSATIIASNGDRTGLVCTNTGSATAFLAFGLNAAVSGYGLAITAGSTWWMDDYMFTTQAIQGIGSTTLSCQEFK